MRLERLVQRKLNQKIHQAFLELSRLEKECLEDYQKTELEAYRFDSTEYNKIHNLLKEEKYKEAYKYAKDMDTYTREGISEDTWDLLASLSHLDEK